MDRGTERILIVCAGIFCMLLGYLLFARDRETHQGRLNFKSKLFSFILSGTGAGLFFMAFGAIIVIFMAFSRVSESETTKTKDVIRDSPGSGEKWRSIEREIIHRKDSRKAGEK